MFSSVSSPMTFIRPATIFLMRPFFGAIVFSGLLLIPSTGYAQDTEDPDWNKILNEMLVKMGKRRVTLSTELVKFDPKTSAAVIEFSNTTDDTLEAEISFATSISGISNAKQAENASGLLTQDAQKAVASNSIDSKWSLIPWITNPPKTIKLAPGEKKSLTFKVKVPLSASPGEYAAWLIASTIPSDKQQVIIEGTEYEISFDEDSDTTAMETDGKPSRMTSNTKLVYNVPVAK